MQFMHTHTHTRMSPQPLLRKKKQGSNKRPKKKLWELMFLEASYGRFECGNGSGDQQFQSTKNSLKLNAVPPNVLCSFGQGAARTCTTDGRTDGRLRRLVGWVSLAPRTERKGPMYVHILALVSGKLTGIPEGWPEN